MVLLSQRVIERVSQSTVRDSSEAKVIQEVGGLCKRLGLEFLHLKGYTGKQIHQEMKAVSLSVCVWWWWW